MAYINIQSVELAMGGYPLFEGINLAVEKGEKVAMVGRNGSGKSTLLRLIEGSIKPDSGWCPTICREPYLTWLPAVFKRIMTW